MVRLDADVDSDFDFGWALRHLFYEWTMPSHHRHVGLHQVHNPVRIAAEFCQVDLAETGRSVDKPHYSDQIEASDFQRQGNQKNHDAP